MACRVAQYLALGLQSDCAACMECNVRQIFRLGGKVKTVKAHVYLVGQIAFPTVNPKLFHDLNWSYLLGPVWDMVKFATGDYVREMLYETL